MENFFKWLAVPVPKDELETFFNLNNIRVEKVDLFFDVMMSLNKTIISTYLGGNSERTNAVLYTEEDNSKHFEWCWAKTIDSFKKENIVLNNEGSHKTYLKNFYNDVFYLKKDNISELEISKFITELFDIEGNHSKADLEILVEMYKIMDLNVKKTN
jgi:hypothetical protein